MEWKVKNQNLQPCTLVFESGEWIASVKLVSNANLIVAAVNACISVNPDNPMSVAESVKDMYEALRDIKSYAQNCIENPVDAQVVAGKCYLALAKAGGQA